MASVTPDKIEDMQEEITLDFTAASKYDPTTTLEKDDSEIDQECPSERKESSWLDRHLDVINIFLLFGLGILVFLNRRSRETVIEADVTLNINVHLPRSIKDGDTTFLSENTKFLHVGPENMSSDATLFTVIKNVIVDSNVDVMYNLQEQGLWPVDLGGYYTSATAKYLTYDNPTDFGDQNCVMEERRALENAISLTKLLNRILILPTFCCNGCHEHCPRTKGRCTLSSHFNITSFHSTFRGLYREHAFLNSRRVPTNVLKSASPLLRIEADSAFSSSKLNATSFSPRNPSEGPSREELKMWLGKYASKRVIRVHSMYGPYKVFSDPQTRTVEPEEFRKGIVLRSRDTQVGLDKL